MKAAAEDVRQELKSMGDPVKAVILQRFFKTGRGQYGEGDVFIGVMVPQSRQIAKNSASFRLERSRCFFTLGFTRSALLHS